MSLKKRIYEDYLKKTRIPQYNDVLSAAKQHGYIMVGIETFYRIITTGCFNPDLKYLINRHDIDTSPKVARKFFQIEKAVFGSSGSATYYFRDSTVDIKLIRDIQEFGYETGYHYEQIATYEKQAKTKEIGVLQQHLPQIRANFLRDLESYRKKTESLSLSVASHGDFINAKYQYQNYEVLKDQKTREASGILVEAYDAVVNESIVERYADQALLGTFSSQVIASINRQCACIMMLTHPRNWEVDLFDTTRENVVRLIQGIKYRW